jgi:hypothetical protein
VAGIFSGVIVAFVMTSTSVTGLFVYFAAVALLMAAIVAFGPRMGIRTPAKKLLDDRALDAVAVGSANEHANNSDATPEKGHQA